ncbi:hypothetical protein GUJ93_ZPchr0458g22285 [Zizania palustris]|uniref:Uncharacterized protein n=1 Tax=Zizania palustris TaxID=103762 RepID=A0A8J5V2V0_ZIZPA|nr:hypothetical protein GUJ93_ZPchr0458g22285 [Zizania palustris]
MSPRPSFPPQAPVPPQPSQAMPRRPLQLPVKPLRRRRPCVPPPPPSHHHRRPPQQAPAPPPTRTNPRRRRQRAPLSLTWPHRVARTESRFPCAARPVVPALLAARVTTPGRCLPTTTTPPQHFPSLHPRRRRPRRHACRRPRSPLLQPRAAPRHCKPRERRPRNRRPRRHACRRPSRLP